MSHVLPSPTSTDALVLSALCGGLTSEEIASLHDLDIATVRCRVRVITSGFRARNRADLMKAASDLIQRVAIEKAAAREESAPSGLEWLTRGREEIDTSITRNRRPQFLTVASSAVVSGVLSVTLPLWPEGIGRVLGLYPDGGSGFLEWAIVVCLIGLTAILSFVAGHEWQRISWQS